MSYQPVFRDGKVHVHKRMCHSCIFLPGNRMQLQPGRVEQMVTEATANESCIPCHEVLGDEPSVCRGFFDQHPTQALQIAARLGVIEFTAPPEESEYV